MQLLQDKIYWHICNNFYKFTFLPALIEDIENLLCLTARLFKHAYHRQ